MKHIVFIILICLTTHLEAQKLMFQGADGFEIVNYSDQDVEAIPLNAKLEFGIKLSPEINQEIQQYLSKNEGGLNPYDIEDVQIEAIFRHEKGFYKKRYGFYYQKFRADVSKDEWKKENTNYNWRIRYSFPEEGKWSLDVTLSVKQKIVLEVEDLLLECVNSEIAGRLIVSQNAGQRYLQYEKTQEPFIIRGHNISNGGFVTFLPSQKQNQLTGVRELQAAGGNFTRFELPAQGALPDFPVHNNYDLKQDEMFGFDEIIDYCDRNEIYFIVFRHHVEIETQPGNENKSNWDKVDWYNNPYRTAFNLIKKSQYFTDSEAIEWQKNCIRYIDARWGYSPKFAFYGYSEVDNWYKYLISDEKFSESEAHATMLSHYLDKKRFMMENLEVSFGHVSSFASLPSMEYEKNTQSFLSESDIVSFHLYGQLKSTNAIQRYEAVSKLYDIYQKPVVIEEAGLNANVLKLYCCSTSTYHDNLWAGLMMGSAGTAMDWWWNRGVHAFNFEKDLMSIKKFCEDIPFGTLTFKPQLFLDEKRGIIPTIANKNELYKTKIENFSLSASNDSIIIGWVHNATNYWRNAESSNPCIRSLIDSNTLSEPCMVEKNYDLNKETNTEFSHKRNLDAYTSKGGVQILEKSKEHYFIIYDVNTRSKGEKVKYEVQFYKIQNGACILMENETAIYYATLNGKLKIYTPRMDAQNPDYAYKIIVK